MKKTVTILLLLLAGVAPAAGAQRGSITFWFSEDVIEQWHHSNDRSKVGHPFVYSDTAVECLLVLRELFQLPYRQTEGLGRSLVELMEISLDIPTFVYYNMVCWETFYI